jgi:hypothetical protein
MPDKHELELFISEEGELKVHIKGIKGPACLKILENIAKKIGEEKERSLTSEYYEKIEGKDLGTTKTT